MNRKGLSCFLCIILIFSMCLTTVCMAEPGVFSGDFDNEEVQPSSAPADPAPAEPIPTPSAESAPAESAESAPAEPAPAEPAPAASTSAEANSATLNTQEDFLRELFGDDYDEYMASQGQNENQNTQNNNNNNNSGDLGSLVIIDNPDAKPQENAPTGVRLSKLMTLKEKTIVEEEPSFFNPNGVTRKVLAFYDDNKELFDVESEFYSDLLNLIYESVDNDAQAGYNELANTKITMDHIPLRTWGEFLNKYYGKTTTNFPLGDIEFKFGKFSFSLKNNSYAKTFVLETLVPNMIPLITQYAGDYPAYRYVLDVYSGSLLKDYTCDLNSSHLSDTVYPLNNGDTLIFYNTGSYYGLSISKNYVSILRGHLEGNQSGYDRPLPNSQYPACVNVLAYIVLIKDLSGDSLNNKTLSDFMMYKNLAVCLDNKEIVDVSDSNTDVKKLEYSDFKLNLDNLLLSPTTDGCVIIQPTYTECFNYAGMNKATGRVVDISDFVSKGENYFTVTDSSKNNTVKVPISYYCDSQSRAETALGNAPFLIYFSSYVPYDIMINWAYNNSGTSFKTTEARDQFIDVIRKDLASKGRSADFDAYLKLAGQRTDASKKMTTFAIIAVIVVGIAVVVIFLKMKAANEEKRRNTVNPSEILFDNNDDDDDGGSEDDNFELK